MANLVWMSTIGAGLLTLWPLTLFIRRRWVRPYRNPKRLLRRIQRSLKLTRSEIRDLQAILGKNNDPILTCQFLLDPTRWPVVSDQESTKKLYSKVFKRP